MRRLRRGHVEAVVEAVLEALQDVALVLERVTRREMQPPRHDPNDHAGLSQRAPPSLRYPPLRSHNFHAWNVSTPYMHLNPSINPLSSLLMRTNDAMV